MTAWKGGYSVLSDAQGEVIPIQIASPASVPSDGIFFDLTGVNSQSPSGGVFGAIKGVTIDATAANVGAGTIRLFFPDVGITRTLNTGVTQVIAIPGNAYRCVFTIIGAGWTSGPINLTFWNTSPTTEVSSNVAVTATGSVTISGTPTVNVSAGQVIEVINPTGSFLNINNRAGSWVRNSVTMINAGATTAFLPASPNGYILTYIQLNTFAVQGAAGNSALFTVVDSASLQIYAIQLYYGSAIAAPGSSNFVEVSESTNITIGANKSVSLIVPAGGGLTNGTAEFGATVITL